MINVYVRVSIVCTVVVSFRFLVCVCVCEYCFPVCFLPIWIQYLFSTFFVALFASGNVALNCSTLFAHFSTIEIEIKTMVVPPMDLMHRSSK